jgi:hypothetical protein
MSDFEADRHRKCTKTGFMLIFQQKEPRKSADAPEFGITWAKNDKN